ncbi:hypothetical protein F5B22DRAFT_178436 [Xylaria bambusicola]|uniref:uncharacterized protein n=1 Tax=Xylaria bambusicola TaxID=326684 RepID=UPI0020074916|nr:uncharacterized protein F5B22DRAFT_178436 [Xylaria bambusicola]KAI0516734.1 hypothetical protein F5B22DRAFT_178436 [Xylaria bambusicola]
MASRAQHLEPAEGREIVFCHICRHEWYRDEHPGDFACPVCGREFIEIVTPESDPRGDDGSADSESDQRFHLHHHHHHHHHDSDSDPEESNIEEHHFHGPGGLFGQRTIHRSPETSAYSRRSRVRPGSSDDIIRRFTEMIDEISGPGMVGRSGPETLFNENQNGPQFTYRTFRGPGYSGGVSSFTITTGTSARRPQGQTGPRSPFGADDPFQRIFSEILSSGPAFQPMDRGDASARDSNQQGNDGDAAGRPMDIGTALNQLLASIVNPGAIHGDAVYSQEALDRIITNLMEANPQSNAPPPATENAIASLPKKKLDEAMLGPELKGECTICIDEVKVGDEVVVLPCRHWFHEECASLWLKQHNSCPVCRAAIDGAAAGKPPNEATSSQNSTRPTDPSSSRPTPAERRRTHLQQRREERLDSIRGVAASSQDRPYLRHRDSYSPPSQNSSAQRSPRVRSPSPSSRGVNHTERGRDNRGSSGSGPLNWIRDRFSGR